MLFYKPKSGHCDHLSSEMWTLARDCTVLAASPLLNVECGLNSKSVMSCLYVQYSH